MASDRFVIISNTRLPNPAKCWCCGAGDRDCVDWGADIAFQGAILICVVCLAEASTLLAPPVDLEKEQMKVQLDTARKILGELNARLVSVLVDASSAIDGAIPGVTPEFAGSNTTSKGPTLAKAE